MNRIQRSYAQETCAWCTGTGKWAISAGYVISCLVCGGKGHISVVQPAGKCQQCQGSGRRSIASPCLTCAGTGWARVFSQG
jgi:DnaJ-class molecular chaperone